MPEIPNVVSGEPVEADWGNDIRDRSVQKYADLTALNASQPLPILGELAWLTNPGYLVVCTGVGPSVWTPLLDQTLADARWVNLAGDTMTGLLTAPSLTATGTVKGNKLEGNLETWYADSSGVVSVDETPTVIGRFTTPAPGSSGRYLLRATMQFNWAELSATNNIVLRVMRAGAQRAYGAQTLALQWSGGGIISGQGNMTVEHMTASVGPGTVFEIDVATSLAPAGTSPSVNATDLDWSARRAWAVDQTAVAAWTP